MNPNKLESNEWECRLPLGRDLYDDCETRVRDLDDAVLLTVHRTWWLWSRGTLQTSAATVKRAGLGHLIVNDLAVSVNGTAFGRIKAANGSPLVQVMLCELCDRAPAVRRGVCANYDTAEQMA